ncbi:MAG: KEOPS complex subunit Pcc1 [Euryarchaeota archaeon]|nr:KEOPS complex subunit Pcc1 [Euryarchaeota archaeon]
MVLAKAYIQCNYKPGAKVNAIAAALEVDNKAAPPTIKVKSYSEKNILYNEIETIDKLETFLSTIDDLLFSILIAESSLSLEDEGGGTKV